MIDVAERRGLNVSREKLEQELKVPVIPVVGYKRKGITELKAAIREAKVAPLPNWTLPDAMREELMIVSGGLAILDNKEDAETRRRGDTETENMGSIPASPRPGVSASSPDGPVPTRAWICQPDTTRRLDRFEAIAERLLIGDRAADYSFRSRKVIRLRRCWLIQPTACISLALIRCRRTWRRITIGSNRWHNASSQCLQNLNRRYWNPFLRTARSPKISPSASMQFSCTRFGGC